MLSSDIRCAATLSGTDPGARFVQEPSVLVAPPAPLGREYLWRCRGSGPCSPRRVIHDATFQPTTEGQGVGTAGPTPWRTYLAHVVRWPGRWVGRNLAWVRHDRFFLALIGFWLVYATYWSTLTILKFYAGNATVWDAGSYMERLWVFSHFPIDSTASGWIATVGQPTQLVLSPLSLPRSYPLLFAFQSLALGAGALPLYIIAVHELHHRLPALLVSLTYLTYFPLAGANWFDLHFQVLFIPLFLAGYALYLKGRYRTSLALLVLGGAATNPYLT